jgi:2-keto-myo-inositol isomerase
VTAWRRCGRFFVTCETTGFRGYFSMELFDKDYWAKSADENLKAGLEKIRAVATQALA